QTPANDLARLAKLPLAFWCHLDELRARVARIAAPGDPSARLHLLEQHGHRRLPHLLDVGKRTLGRWPEQREISEHHERGPADSEVACLVARQSIEVSRDEREALDSRVGGIGCVALVGRYGSVGHAVPVLLVALS